MAEEVFKSGAPDYPTADLPATNVVELQQPVRPAPYFLPRGIGPRSGVWVYTLGPGGVAKPRDPATG
jgi:hypothetical protein